jgi:hypothetical protein
VVYIMSTLSVDKVEPVGSTLTFGESGDTFVIPTGAVFTNNGSATGFAAGSTHASQWRLTTDFTGDAQPIGDATGTIALVNTGGYGSLGSNMTEAAGVFTFPNTGYWLLTGQFVFTNTVSAQFKGYIDYSSNAGGSWATASACESSNYYSLRGNTSLTHMVKITDLSNQKIRWGIDATAITAGAVVTTRGDASITETGFTFNRLAGI